MGRGSCWTSTPAILVSVNSASMAATSASTAVNPAPPKLGLGRLGPFRYLCPLVLAPRSPATSLRVSTRSSTGPRTFPSARTPGGGMRPDGNAADPAAGVDGPNSAAFASGKPDPPWLAEVRRQVRLVGNHPSVIMWGVSPNSFETRRWPYFVKNEPVQYAYARNKRKAATVALLRTTRSTRPGPSSSTAATPAT